MPAASRPALRTLQFGHALLRHHLEFAARHDDYDAVVIGPHHRSGNPKLDWIHAAEADRPFNRHFEMRKHRQVPPRPETYSSPADVHRHARAPPYRMRSFGYLIAQPHLQR